MRHTMDMTKQKTGRLLLSFAAPMIATNALQQLYNVADGAVVGQLLGTESFASVGSAGWVYWLALSVLVGFTQGFSVLLAQRFGAEDLRGMRRALFSAACLMAVFSVLLSLAGFFLSRSLLKALGTPGNIMDGAVLYLQYLFAGMLVTGAYNLLAASLRALGNGRAPLAAVVIASVLNIGLNILFVSVFSMGITGVAIATLISQVFACAFCAFALWRIEAARMRREDMAIDGQTMKRLLGLGWPLALRNGVIGLGGLAVQYVINGFGYVFVAGITAARKFTDFSAQIGEGLEGAVATFTGQNLGAGKMDRVRKGIRVGMLMALVSAAVLFVVLLLLGRPMLRLFLTDGPGVEAALDYGAKYLTVMSGALALQFAMQVFKAALEGIGDTVTPLLSGMLEALVRVLALLLLPFAIGVSGVYMAEPIGWGCAALLLFATLGLRVRKPKMF